MLEAPRLDRVFHALGDAHRRAIVERLSDGPASVSELAAPLSVTLAAVVQHVQVLEDCGMVRTEKVGRVRTCRLAPEGLDVAQRWLNERRERWGRRLDRLGAVLAEATEPKGSHDAAPRAEAAHPGAPRAEPPERDGPE